jgi:hypothetical protein
MAFRAVLTSVYLHYSIVTHRTYFYSCGVNTHFVANLPECIQY